MTDGTCLFLVELFEATNGSNWANLDGWLTSSDPCEWQGVICRDTSVVVNLGSNNLVGHIPVAIAAIANVESLNLAGNHITGALPAGLVRTDLAVLNLDDNCVDDSAVQASWLAGRRYLPGTCDYSNDLPACSIVTVLTNAECEALISLYQSTGGPTWTNNDGWIQGNPCLWFGVNCNFPEPGFTLRLGDNNLLGTLPPELGAFTRLRVLDLGGNELTGDLPPGFADFTALQLLDLSGSCVDDQNLLIDIPNLTYSPGDSCSNIQTCVTDPGRQHSLTQRDCAVLYELYAATNGDNWDRNDGWLTDTDPCRWRGVRCDRNGAQLVLAANNLVGELPDGLFEATSFRSLSFPNNQLTGRLPSAALVGLNSLDLTNNCIDDSPFAESAFDRIDYTPGRYCPLEGNIPECNGPRSNVTTEQCEALVSVFNTMGGTEWTRNQGWLTSTDPCTWFGLRCDPLAREPEISLSLPSNNVSGPLDPLLAVLNGTVSLERNEIISDWPSELDAARWKRADLSGNCIEAPGPAFRLSLFTPGTACPITSSAAECDGLFSGVEASVCEFLVELYEQTDGTNWADNSGWATRTDPCGWIRVTCLRSGIVSVNLYGNGLAGVIPTSIGAISSPMDLSLGSNALTGALPANLATSAITHLDLSESCIDDSDPTIQAWLTTITYSAGTTCPMVSDEPICNGVPSELPGEACEALMTLYRATAGPDWRQSAGWGTRSNPCVWTGVLCTFGSPGFELQLAGNNLEGPLPAELFSTGLLSGVDLSSNQLSGSLPNSLIDETLLRRLDLSGSCVDGSAPELAGFLQRLDYRAGRTCEIESPVAACDGLVSLLSPRDCEGLVAFFVSTGGSDWTNNEGWLTNNDPCSWFGVTCTNARFNPFSWRLTLPDNNLSGVLPPELGDTGVVRLILQGNSLTGTVPGSWSNLRLSRFFLEGSCVDDSDPALTAFFDHLSFDYLAGNSCELASDLPECNGLPTALPAQHCEGIVSLYTALGGAGWSDNDGWLTRTDPCQWFGVTCDLLPEGVGYGYPYFISISLPNNNLVGELPAVVGGIAGLENLRLPGNSISGALPVEWVALDQLGNLDLTGSCIDATNPLLTQFLGRSSYRPGGNCVISSTYPECDGVNTAMPGGTCEFLVDLYRAADGPNWTRSTTNWETAPDPCDWFEVECPGINFGDVRISVSIRLNNAGLVGNLPPSVARIRGVDTLDLSGNQLTGSLAPGVAETLIRTLDLEGNCVEHTSVAPDWVVMDNYTPGKSCMTSSAVPACDGHDTQMTSGTCEALVRLYEATGGPQWANNDGWLEGDPCLWYGVNCSSRTMHLSFGSNNLTGTIPDMRGLGRSTLVLSDNNLDGPLPESFVTIPLLSLYLQGNCVQTTALLDGYLAQLDRYSAGNTCELSSTVPACDGLATPLSAPECEALVDLYEALNGNRWRVRDGWLTRTDPCTWAGVNCSESAVEFLQFFRFGLQGELPSSIGDLSQVWYLGLGNNPGLVGPVPVVIASLEHLTNVELFCTNVDDTQLVAAGLPSRLLTYFGPDYPGPC